MDNACIIGGRGVVGSATADVFGISKIFDLKGSTITLQEAAKCKFCFICLPTEVDLSGAYDTSAIVGVIKEIESYGTSCIYIIRSTVYPGFARSLGIDRIVSNPEFLTMSTAVQDSHYPPFILLGGQETYVREVKALYEGRIKSAPVITSDNTTAEMSKLALNGFFATKVIYANEIYDYCQKVGANYERVREVLTGHPFGYRNHDRIFFHDQRGVHGKCLPKDSRALAHYSQGELINKVVEVNKKYQ